MSKIAVIGSGAFGTALAVSATRSGHDVVLWGRNATVIETMNVAHTNHDYLPNITLPATVRATTALADINGADAVLLAAPVQSTPDILPLLTPHIAATTPLVICSKGLQQQTGQRLDEMVRSWRAEQRFALLSGPCFADELAHGKPTAVVIAAPDIIEAAQLCKLLATESFRPYAQDDVIGTALSGALKNPLAIGAGVIAAADLGDNARAAFITRGIAEITRLGMACGANVATFIGLAGVGDIFLTCSSPHSRNYAYGYALARGEPLPTKTVEGLPTIAAALKLGQQHQMELPLMQALYNLCYDKQPLDKVLRALLARPLKEE